MNRGKRDKTPERTLRLSPTLDKIKQAQSLAGAGVFNCYAASRRDIFIPCFPYRTRCRSSSRLLLKNCGRLDKAVLPAAQMIKTLLVSGSLAPLLTSRMVAWMVNPHRPRTTPCLASTPDYPGSAPDRSWFVRTFSWIVLVRKENLSYILITFMPISMDSQNSDWTAPAHSRRYTSPKTYDNIIGRPLTDRRITMYENRGWYSQEQKSARKARAEKGKKRDNFVLIEGRLVYRPL